MLNHGLHRIIDSDSSLHFLINHIFLPPKLPQSCDLTPEKHHMLLQVVKVIWEDYVSTKCQLQPGTTDWSYSNVISPMINAACKIHATQVDADTLERELEGLQYRGVIVIYVECQNAGVIIRKSSSADESTIIETFEASSPTSAVMDGPDRKLLCYYPGPSISIPDETFRTPELLHELAKFLAEMSKNNLSLARRTSKKAGKSQDEIRDVNRPFFITELLLGILEGMGGQRLDVDQLGGLKKRIADDVVWDRSLLPWRRSPLWLVMRVALQSSIQKDVDGGFRAYKAFMVFFLSKLLAATTQRFTISSDLIRVMAAKVSRRAYKLKGYGGDEHDWVRTISGEVVNEVTSGLESRWMQIQEVHQSSKPHVWGLKSLDIEGDTVLSMTNSRPFITSVLESFRSGTQKFPRSMSHVEDSYPRIAGSETFHPGYLQGLIGEAGDSVGKFLLLADFEDWVEVELDSWVAKNMSEYGSKSLAQCLEDYNVAARDVYDFNPEKSSTMILTILELWIAMDKITIHLVPRLAQHRAAEEIDLDILHKLILPKQSQLERLHHVEQYLQDRREASLYPSILSDTITTNSFSVRYVASSNSHQVLIMQIERAAEQERVKRKALIQEVNRKYHELMLRYRTENCIYTQAGHHRYRSCTRCGYRRSANDLKVDVHEWPLPEDGNKKYAVAFELQCPEDFARYRDITYAVIVDMLTPDLKLSASDPKCGLTNYLGLCNYRRGNVAQRITWSSDVKSFAQSHYESKPAPTNEGEILQKHALRYTFHDARKKLWVKSALEQCDISNLTTFLLPGGGIYSNLQYAVDGTEHTSNSVIANQQKCHNDLLLAEYESFCTLRAGHRLQWLNIAREIVARGLSFKNVEVWMLIMQTIWEAGPRGDDGAVRASHIDLEEAAFCLDLINAMGELLVGIKANWCEGISARILIIITTRLALQSQDEEVLSRAFTLLDCLRKVTYEWTQQLVTQNQKHPDPKTQRLLLEMAITTRMTFNTDPIHMPGIIKSEENVIIFVQCLIIIHDNTPIIRNTLPNTLKYLLQRDMQLSHDIQEHFLNSLRNNRRGLDHAVKQAWPAYPGYNTEDTLSSWELPEDHESLHLLRVIPADVATGRGEVAVQLDLITGEFLINGSPFGRLPNDYTKHVNYQRIFGQAILDVCPSSTGGMSYEMKQKMKGNTVFFALRNGTQLVIRMLNEGRETIEILPHTAFKGDLPDAMVNDYAHCLNLYTGELELRPLAAVWASSESNWWTECDTMGNKWFMKQGREGLQTTLIDYRSKTMNVISKIMSPIEGKPNLQISIRWLSPEEGKSQLVVHLHRFKLDFALRGEELDCTSLPGLLIDTNQNMGTMVGLKNYLVLCERGGLSKYNRQVIIPHGKISYSQGGSGAPAHTIVSISTSGGDSVTYHKYKIDAILGRLVGSSRMASMLYQNRIHALTAFCLPDPLTGLTGTETALENLRQGNMKSFRTIINEDLDELLEIAKLTPQRHWYPEHLKRMQTVEWDKVLPPTAQHGDFRDIAMDILQHWENISFFHSDDTRNWKSRFSNFTDKGEHLRNRAKIRNAVYYASPDPTCTSTGTDMEHLPYVEDEWHEFGKPEANSRHIADIIFNWSIKLDVSSNILYELQTWSLLQGTNTNLDVSLTYTHWLHDIKMNEIWMALHKQCVQATPAAKYGMAFMFSTLAFRTDVSLQHLETLIALATPGNIFPSSERFLEHIPLFELDDGYVCRESEIEGHLSRQVVSFEQSAAYSLPAQYNESSQEAGMRRQNVYDSDRQAEMTSMMSKLRPYWNQPAIPSTGLSFYEYKIVQLNVTARDAIDKSLRSWHRNRELKAYIGRMQTWINANITHESHGCPLPTVRACISGGHRMSVDCEVSLGRILKRTETPAVDDITPPPQHPTSLAILHQSTRYCAAMGGSIQALPIRTLNDVDVGPCYEPQERDEMDEENDDAGHEQLLNLVESFRDGVSGFEKQYAEDMMRSCNALTNKPGENVFVYIPHAEEDLAAYQVEWETYVARIMATLQGLLKPSEDNSVGMYSNRENVRMDAEFGMVQSGIWPAVTPRSILAFLRNTKEAQWMDLKNGWRQLLTAYALGVIGLQRTQRLLQHHGKGDVAEYMKDLNNTGCQGWDAEDYPEWLLFQIENSLIIRPVQADIAREMMDPQDGGNAVMQLNMGEGKSSVIVPAIAAALADGKKLVRVIVLKPLAGQMFRLLASKLGGVVNRRIYYLPFSRNVHMGDIKTAHNIQRLYEECMANGGILLVQPEHLLSFKLMGIERIGEGEASPMADQLVYSARWLQAYARDILDESDEILSVKYQLLYTIGVQKAFDGAPYRWVAAQQILYIIRRQIMILQEEYPNDVQLDLATCKGARFPLTRIPRADIVQILIDRTADMIIYEGIQCTSFAFYQQDQRNLALRYITTEAFTQEEFDVLQRFCSETDLNILHLIRGLITYQILAFAFREKRYRVDYGLALERTDLAVPYRAKDSPAPRAEFGHPDVTIILTCLTYYYRGLEMAELKVCFELLYKRDNPELEYGKWVSEGHDTIPSSLKELNGVNLLDQHQFSAEVWVTFKFNKAAIDFYLSTKVFPKQAKEFVHKLSASGWDIAEKRTFPTTGFSGTNDNQYVLPLSIEQRDSDEQLHTNAKVLSYLLQPENRKYERGKSEGRLSIDEVLNTLVRDGVQVLLDVGAQILELSNEEVARRWLQLTNELDGGTVGGNSASRWRAVIFFDANDDAMVFSGKDVEHFETSSFSMNMQQCLVYLDEAHTRGTDFKLPTNSTAAVALGPGLTKDRLVQACMRMRKLGHGQSVRFIAPAEVDEEIRELADAMEGDIMTSLDVIRWAMDKTTKHIQHSIPLWANQGSTYQLHQDAWEDYCKDGEGDLKLLKKALLERESRTLKEMYGVPKVDYSLLPLNAPIPDNLSAHRVEMVEKIRTKCAFFEVKSLQEARMQEEQEREIAHEIERETQVERPLAINPATHQLSKELVKVVTKGTRPRYNSHDIFPAFKMLQRTSLRDKLELSGWPGKVYATKDFATTVCIRSTEYVDDYTRPVHWILYDNANTIRIILSPYEAQELLPRIRTSKVYSLFVYAPKVRLAMKSLEGLRFCPTPRMNMRTLIGVNSDAEANLEMNLFAGQLYIKDYTTYLSLCDFLGIYVRKEQTPRTDIAYEVDGFVPNVEQRGMLGMTCLFERSPVGFLKGLMTMRRKNLAWEGTHMGDLLGGYVYINEGMVKSWETESVPWDEMLVGPGDFMNEEEDDMEVRNGVSIRDD